MSDVITAKSLADELAIECTINCRYYGGTHIARGLGKTASCTMGDREAALALAGKIANGRTFTLTTFTNQTYLLKVRSRD